MNEKDRQMLREMRRHLGKLHQAWRDDPEGDGHCKSNEGYVGVLFRYPNWFECSSEKEYAEAKPVLSMVEVYSYLFGPTRLHQFGSIEEAYKEVMSW